MQHVCHLCGHKFSSTEMKQVSLNAEGEFADWTPERVEWFRSRWKKLPRLVWLCNACYRTAKRG